MTAKQMKRHVTSGRKHVWPWAIVICLLVGGVIGGYAYIQHQDKVEAALNASRASEQSRQNEIAQAVDVDTFYDGVFVDNIALSGLTYDQAKEKVLAQRQKEQDAIAVTVVLDENNVKYTAADMKVTTDVEDVLTKAMQVGRTGTRDERYAYIQQLPTNPVKLTTTMTVDPSALEAKVRELANSWKIDPVEPTVNRI